MFSTSAIAFLAFHVPCATAIPIIIEGHETPFNGF